MLKSNSIRRLVLIVVITQISCAAISHHRTPQESSIDETLKPDSDLVLHTLGKDLPILTSNSDRDKYVGQLVIVRGVYVNSKSPTIAGVGVAHADLGEQQSYAIGILSRYEFTKTAHDEIMAESRKNGNLIGPCIRGPGVYYSLLQNVKENKLAKPRPAQSWYSIFGVVLGVN